MNSYPRAVSFLMGRKVRYAFGFNGRGKSKKAVLIVLVLGLFVLFYKVNGGVQEESKDSTNTAAEGG